MDRRDTPATKIDTSVVICSLSRTPVPRWRLVVCAALLALFSGEPGHDFASAQPPRQSHSGLMERHRRLVIEYKKKLAELTEDCRTAGQSSAVAVLEGHLPQQDDQDLQNLDLPQTVQPDPAKTAPPADREWQTKLRELDKKQAQELFLLSRAALHSGYPSLAYRLVRETAWHDSDHPQARRLLGFERHGDEWVTAIAARLLKEQYVWTDEFGWLKKSLVDRYENGERFCLDRWMTPVKEAEIRRDFRHAWEVRVDHYIVRTNVSFERGVEVAKMLEDYHRFFHEIFAGYYQTPEQMRKIFEGQTAGGRTAEKPFQVHFYKLKDEYVERLRAKLPQVAMTNGYYDADARIAHFFEDPEGQPLATLVHEATHQLLYESHSGHRPIGEHAHFWIAEGIACYVESFRRTDQSMSVGNPRYIRFVNARENLLRGDYYIPLRQLSAMSAREFQHDPEIVKLYAETAGLTQFFMHYAGGKYRDALITHLSQLYSPKEAVRNRVQSLAELTGVSFEELDKQYREFSQELDQRYLTRDSE